MAIGIYKITNLINHKSYIGQSVDIGRRISRHKTAAKNKEDYPLYHSINKYGLENFSFEILEECKKEELNNREIYWIKYYDSTKNGYNLTTGGQALALFIHKLSQEDVNNIIDMLKNRLDLSQKDIAHIMMVGEDTISEINNGKSRVQEGIDYPIRKNSNKHYCIDCGSEIYSGSTRCVSCYSIFQRKVERPDREELKKLLRIKPFTQIAAIYGVSDNAVRKWCVKENLPRLAKEIKSYSDEEWDKL